MNGISFVISKSCCPVYNFGISSKINHGTCNKIDLIPCRLPNLNYQRSSPFEATKQPMLKHRVSAFKDGTDSGFEVPEVTSAMLPSVILCVGTVGMTLAKAWEVVVKFISTRGVLKPNAFHYILLAVSAAFLARCFVAKILCGFVVLRDKPFSTGDTIQVGCLKGQVMDMGVKTTSLLTAENHRISLPTSWFYGQAIVNKSRTTTVIPYSVFCGQAFVKKPQLPWHPMVSKIYVDKDKFEKIPKISEEITNMMRSNYPCVYLDEQQPYCNLSKVDESCELTLGCYLRQMSEDELYSAKEYILLRSARIIKKHVTS